ncbi:MAG: type II toxin-antitoxin system RelE family toxin [Terriglobales bacterium]
MAWSVELAESADRELGKLDAQHRKRILNFLHGRVPKLDDPRSLGEALRGSRLGEFWKYRVGDDRLICKIEDDRLVVLVLRVGHRKEIYRRGVRENRSALQSRRVGCLGLTTASRGPGVGTWPARRRWT